MLAVVMVAAIGVGVLAAVTGWATLTDTRTVLVARDTIVRGSVIQAEDLTEAQVGADVALDLVSAGARADVVGQRAAWDVAAGTALTTGAMTEQLVPPSGMSVLGIVLPPPASPGLALLPGDRVRAVVTATDPASEQTPTFHEAEVVAVNPPAPDGQTVVDVLVTHEEAITLAAEAAAGKVTLVLDSRELDTDANTSTSTDEETDPTDESGEPSGSPETEEG
ncbi:SAF domain-containing protein [Promicromonospora sp. AC04]|uniref:SAF domain-containing protein n=1 Tax=Promicromonospora sp. AC04 TaxID=2135723 RepID=UPI0013049C46|nr:SAF domain-containing protein [Promicromonospora sp. AC04]